MKRLNAQARITEVNDICHRIVVLYKQKTWNDAFLKQMMDGIEQRTTMLTEIINQDVALSKLDEADQKRDASVKALNKILEGYRVMPLPTLQAHAEQLATVFGRYGTRIADENYTTESSLIEALLSDLSAPALQTAIGALTGVSEIIARLRSEQNEFTQLRVEYEKAVAQQKKATTATDLKRWLLETLNTKLIPYLAAMQMANAAEFASFANSVEQVIMDAYTTIARRSSATKGAKASAKKGKATAPSSADAPAAPAAPTESNTLPIVSDGDGGGADQAE